MTFSVSSTPRGLAVVGEVDVATAPALSRALRARAGVGGRMEIDLGEVAFVDVVGARTFFEVARDLPPDAVLVLRRTPPILRRILELVRWDDPRVEVEPG